MHLTLPWPPSELSPNKRMHYQRLAKIKARYRDRCRIETLLHKLPAVPSGPLHLLLVFVPPDRRRRDLDNLHSSCKAGQDGMAEALRIDDSRFRSVTVQMAEPEKGRACVRVTIAPLDRAPFVQRDAAGMATGVAL